MLLLFDKITNKPIIGPNSNSSYPDGPAIEFLLPQGYAADQVKEVRIHDTQALAQRLITGEYGSYEHDHVYANAIIIYDKISISTDKQQIAADGVDTAIVTATLPASAADETVNFEVARSIYPVLTVNRVATLQVKTTIKGDIPISIKSATKYGQNSLVLKGV